MGEGICSQINLLSLTIRLRLHVSSFSRMVVGRQTPAGRRRVPGRRGHCVHAQPGKRAPFQRIAPETRTGNVRIAKLGPGERWRNRQALFRSGGHGVQ